MAVLLGAIRTNKLLSEHIPYFKKVSKLQAKSLYKKGKEVFGLRSDGSESLIERVSDFEKRGFYAFGLEK